MNDHAELAELASRFADVNTDGRGRKSWDFDEHGLRDFIAALEAGRSGDAGKAAEEAFVAVSMGGLNTTAQANALMELFRLAVAAAPQQPPPVGVADADDARRYRFMMAKENMVTPGPLSGAVHRHIESLGASGDEAAALWQSKGVWDTVIDRLSQQEAAPRECCNSFPCEQPTADNGACPVSEPAASESQFGPVTEAELDEARVELPASMYGLVNKPDAASGEGLHAALCFLGELESVGNAKAGEIARGLRRLTTTGQGDVERLVEAAKVARASLATVVAEGGPECEHEAGVCFCEERAAACNLAEALRPFADKGNA